MASGRTDKIAKEMKRVIADVILFDLKDPRLSRMTSVTRVTVTGDLSYSKVYVSVYDTDEKRASSMEALRSSEGFIKRKINDSIKMRKIPSLEFILDDSIEYGAYMSRIIDEVNAESNGNKIQDS